MDDLADIAAWSDRLGAALRAGDLRALEPLLREGIEERLATIGATPRGFSQAALAVLRRRADENAALLSASQRGIRAALRRIEEVRGVASGLATYDAQGRRANAPTTLSADRRA